MPTSTPSAGAKRAVWSVTRSSKHAPDSFPRTTHLARRPWRRALAEEHSLPSGVMGPVERAALAREASIRLGELISSSHRILRRHPREHVNSFGFNEILL